MDAKRAPASKDLVFSAIKLGCSSGTPLAVWKRGEDLPPPPPTIRPGHGRHARLGLVDPILFPVFPRKKEPGRPRVLRMPFGRISL